MHEWTHINSLSLFFLFLFKDYGIVMMRKVMNVFHCNYLGIFFFSSLLLLIFLHSIFNLTFSSSLHCFFLFSFILFLFSCSSFSTSSFILLFPLLLPLFFFSSSLSSSSLWSFIILLHPYYFIMTCAKACAWADKGQKVICTNLETPPNRMVQNFQELINLNKQSSSV